MASLDGGLIFERQTKLGGQHDTTLEPRRIIFTGLRGADRSPRF